MEELFDKELQGMVKFTDATKQQTGQMQASAAVPSMCACALLAGVGVGKHWKWR